MTNVVTALHEAIDKYVRCTSQPVGVKLAQAGAEIPQKAKYPLTTLGHRISVCQGMTIARTIGWTMAFRKEDHGCPLAHLFLGHVKPDIFLEGAIAGPYQEDEGCARIMEATFPRRPVGSVAQTWLAPLKRCKFKPDLAIMAKPSIPASYFNIDPDARSEGQD